MYPQIGVVGVLFFKTVFFKFLTAEGAHYTDTGEVFLCNGGQDSFVLVAFLEAATDAGVEKGRITDDDWNRAQGDEGEAAIHGEHEGQRQSHQNDDSDDGGELLSNEDFDAFHVGGAALNDVSGLVFHVPSEGELLYMGKKLITHGLHETFRTFGVEKIVEILEYGCQTGDDDHDQCYVAEVVAEEGCTAQGIDLLGHHGGKAKGLTAND